MHFVDAKGILTGGKGRYGMNIYRGCSHGCIYCDSRSRCYQFTHAFEDIEVKRNAPELLEQALRSKREKCMIGTGSMSDPYMHCEEKLGLTRQCLEIICRYGFGAAVQTKSDRILRDIDLLEEINRKAKCVVQVTLTTWDDQLCGMAHTHSSVHQRHGGKRPGPPGGLRVGTGERNHLLRHGADPPGGRPGILLRGAGPALPRTEGEVYPHLRECL